MDKAASIMLPAALFAAWLTFIIVNINIMTSQENNNRVHAILLGCEYLGKPKDFETVLYFDCNGLIEMHKEIDWKKV